MALQITLNNLKCKRTVPCLLVLSLLSVILSGQAFAQDNLRLIINTGHTSAVSSVAFSPDSNTLASASWDKTIRLWNLKSRIERRIIFAATSLTSIAFSPDGKWLASGGDDSNVRVWDADSGCIKAVLKGHLDGVTEVVFSPNGTTLASASKDKTIVLWNVELGTQVHVLAGHTEGVNSVSFDPQGEKLASGSTDKSLRIWDVSTGKQELVFPENEDRVRAVAFSPDGQRVVIASNKIKVFDLHTQVSRILSDKGDGQVAFNPDGKSISVTVTPDHLNILNASSGKQLKSILTGSSAVSVATSANGKYLAAGILDGSIRIWNLPSTTDRRIGIKHMQPVMRVAFSPDGTKLSMVVNWFQVRILDLVSNKWYVFPGQAVAFSADKKTVAIAKNDNSIEIRNLKTNKTVRFLLGHSDMIWSLDFSPDDNILASASSDKTIRLWNVATGAEIHSLVGHTNWVRLVRFSPDGKMLASKDDGNSIRIWDAHSGSQLQAFTGQQETEEITFSPEAATLASCGSDGTIRFWNPVSGKQLSVLSANQGIAWSVASCPIDHRFAAGFDDCIRLWDQSTGKTIRLLNDPSGAIWSIAFSANGKVFASCSSNGAVKIRNSATGDEICTIFPLDSNDWCVTDSNNHFVASPAAMKLLNWYKGQEIFNFQTFKSEYYDKNLVSKIYETSLKN